MAGRLSSTSTNSQDILARFSWFSLKQWNHFVAETQLKMWQQIPCSKGEKRTDIILFTLGNQSEVSFPNRFKMWVLWGGNRDSLRRSHQIQAKVFNSLSKLILFPCLILSVFCKWTNDQQSNWRISNNSWS